MRLLMLSWRYLGHPQAGGAEVATHEILRRLAARGHEVTAFSGSHPGAPAGDELDGVRVLRRGRQWSVHVQAWRWLRGRLDRYDRVIDQINTIPFFTPAYVPEPQRRGYIHQLAREYWWRETRGLFRLASPAGYVAEPLYLRAYRSTRMLAVSESTAADLRGVGIPAERISVLPAGIAFEPVASLGPRGPGLRIVMLSRLTPAKFIEEGIEAFARVRRARPDAELVVAGAGDERYAQRLRRLADRLGCEVRFAGRVDEAEKRRLLEQAHLHLFTSHREGWGLVVTEAAALGTPSVGYDVPGVRDSIGEPRLLAPVGRTDVLAERMLALTADRAGYEALRTTAWRRTAELTYEAAADRFEAAL